MRRYYSSGPYAFMKARQIAGKTGVSQVVFEDSEGEYIIVPRSSCSIGSCVEIGELLGATFYKEVIVLK